MTSIFKAFAPISKVDDEQRMVYGYASTDTKDSQGDIVKLDAIEEALPDYMRFGNIREMHTMSAVGVAKSAEVDDKGLFLAAKVVDEAAWIKVKEGVYKGFSIGGKALEKSDGVINKLRLTEISLVDRPANQECVIDCWKAEGADDAAAAEPTAEPAVEPAAEPAPAVEPTGDAPAAAVDAPAAEPAAEDTVKADHFADIRKYADAVDYNEGKPIWDAANAISAMGAIFDLLCSESYETEKEPEQQASLRAAIDALKAFVVAELQERVENGTSVAMADGATDDVAKAGAVYSKSTKAAIAKAHEAVRNADKIMCAMGYDDTTKADAVDGDVADLAKAAGIDADTNADIAKAALADLAKAHARVRELESKPAPAKAAVTAIAKSDDVQDSLADGSATDKLNPNDPLAMFKAALSRPISMVGGQQISQPSSVN